MKDGLYNKLVQEYLSLNSEKRKLIRAVDKASAQLEIVENMLTDLNDILCKHGNHVYEHFEESEGENGQESNT